MAIRCVQNDENVKLMIDQIINHFEEVFEEQVTRVEEDWCWEGTWIIREVLCYPEYVDNIIELQIFSEEYAYSPDLFSVLMYLAGKLEIEYIWDGDKEQEIEGLDEIEALIGVDPTEYEILVIKNNKYMNEIMHLIDGFELLNDFSKTMMIYCLNDNNDLYLAGDLNGNYIIYDFEPFYEFLDKVKINEKSG